VTLLTRGATRCVLEESDICRLRLVVSIVNAVVIEKSNDLNQSAIMDAIQYNRMDDRFT
jgi:hypothetical protein